MPVAVRGSWPPVETYWMWPPETALAMMRGWISLVPSKIV
jgi:hypothetical protein